MEVVSGLWVSSGSGSGPGGLIGSSLRSTCGGYRNCISGVGSSSERSESILGSMLS